jgi:hypothetical protein
LECQLILSGREKRKGEGILWDVDDTRDVALNWSAGEEEVDLVV